MNYDVAKLERTGLVEPWEYEGCSVTSSGKYLRKESSGTHTMSGRVGS